jgi:SMODS and SLOG-associating 2TM effector domain 1/Protein of unknown function (DUF4231)
MPVLTTLAGRQVQWSKTADALKARIDSARWSVFALSILGALAAALASQIAEPSAANPSSGTLRAWVAGFGVCSLAAATFFSSRLLAEANVTDWVRARAISERLKREAYRFAAAASPYDVPATADGLLQDEQGRIEQDGADLEGKLIETTAESSLPTAALTPDAYIARRPQQQIDWYIPKAKKYQTIAQRLRWIEFALSLAATLITAAAGVIGKSAPVLGVQFDLAALTAVLTTVAGAILAHIEASRYDFQVMTFRAAANRLQNRLDRPHQPWSDFVNDCENILATENTSWIAKWSKAPPKEPKP